MRSILIDHEKVKNKYILQIAQGGTGADTQKEAIDNLGGVWTEEIDKPGGIAGYDENKHISQHLIPEDTAFGVPVNLHGPQDLLLGEEGVVTITNYDSFTNYNIVYVGCTGYQNKDKIHVTVGMRQGAYIKVNGSVFALDPHGNRPLQPDIVGGVLEETVSFDGKRGLGAKVNVLETGGILVGSPRTLISSLPNAGVIDYVETSNIQRSFTPSIELTGLAGNTYYGSLFASTDYLNNDTLVIGTRTTHSTGLSRMEIFQGFKDSIPSKTYHEAPTGAGTLESLAISRDASLIAAGYPFANQSKGAVSLYQKGDVGYNLMRTVSDVTNTSNDFEFGTSVALGLDGKLLVVASKRSRDIILFQVASLIMEQERFTLPGDVREVYTVVLSEANDKIAVGAATMMNKGQVLIYEKVEGGWVLKSTLMQSDTLPFESGFGKTISTSKDFSVIAVAAPGSASLIGRVYLFFNGTDSYEHYKTLGEVESYIGDGFGASVSLDPEGRHLWVGVPGTNFDPGKVLKYGGLFDYL